MEAAVKARPVADLAMSLDPAEFYGEDMAGCPDWPITLGFNPGGEITRADDAEKRLDQIRWALHPDRETPLRDPTDKERADLRARLFTTEKPIGFEQPDEASWRNRHGIGGLIPRGQGELNKLNLMVEAAHIRGFIQKRKTAADRAKVQMAVAEKDRAEGNLARFTADHERYAEEAAGLKEAAERHRQACEDERAFNRHHELTKHVLPGLEQSARQAANTLGVAPPSFQTVE